MRTNRSLPAIALVTAIALIAAMSTPAAVGANLQGEALYLQKCEMCHGQNGEGGFAHRSIKRAKASRIVKGIEMRADMEVWISDWAVDGGLVILDSVTLQEIARISGLPTPTGKFNVYNTSHDVY